MNSKEQIVDLHNNIKNRIQTHLTISSDFILISEKSDYHKLQELESLSFGKQFDENQNDSIVNLVKKRDNSFDEFLEKNNAHIIRLTEYKKYWGESTTNDLLDDIIINIDGFNEIALPPTENIPQNVSPFFPRNWYLRIHNLPDLTVRAIVGEITYLRSKRHEWGILFSKKP